MNRRIVGARNFEDILAIVEAEHGEFDAVNAATACSRLAKAARSSVNSAEIDNPRVQALFRTIARLGPRMKPQEVANIIWGLATLEWQPGEGHMRGALEGAAVRVAPSMNVQNVANTIWGLATLGWQAGEGPMRGALEAAAVRVAPSMNAQDVANTIWGLATLGWQPAEGPMRGALEAAAVRVAPSMKADRKSVV